LVARSFSASQIRSTVRDVVFARLAFVAVYEVDALCTCCGLSTARGSGRDAT
jgi:hypothetical protein